MKSEVNDPTLTECEGFCFCAYMHMVGKNARIGRLWNLCLLWSQILFNFQPIYFDNGANCAANFLVDKEGNLVSEVIFQKTPKERLEIKGMAMPER